MLGMKGAQPGAAYDWSPRHRRRSPIGTGVARLVYIVRFASHRLHLPAALASRRVRGSQPPPLPPGVGHRRGVFMRVPLGCCCVGLALPTTAPDFSRLLCLRGGSSQAAVNEYSSVRACTGRADTRTFPLRLESPFPHPVTRRRSSLLRAAPFRLISHVSTPPPPAASTPSTFSNPIQPCCPPLPHGLSNATGRPTKTPRCRRRQPGSPPRGVSVGARVTATKPRVWAAATVSRRCASCCCSTLPRPPAVRHHRRRRAVPARSSRCCHPSACRRCRRAHLHPWRHC